MDWNEKNGRLSRTFKFKDFREGFEFLKKVAELAEERGHHPDLHQSWNEVTLELFTHSENRITEKDRNLAKEIDGLL